MISQEERVADLLTDLKTKMIDLEEIIREHQAGTDKDDLEHWYIGLRQGQLATFQFVVCAIEGTDVMDVYGGI